VVAAHLESGGAAAAVVRATVDVGYGALPGLGDKSLTVGCVGLSKAQSRLGALLGSLPVAFVATSLDGVVNATVVVSHRTLRVTGNQCVAIPVACGGILSRAQSRLRTLLGCLPVSMGTAGLEGVVITAADISNRALLVTRNQSVAIPAAFHTGMGVAQSGLSAFLGRLPVAISAASLKGVVGAATDVGGRALVVTCELGTALHLARDIVCLETGRSLGALLQSLPIAILTANLDGVVAALLSVDGRAMLRVAFDIKNTVAVALVEFGVTVRGIAALFHPHPSAVRKASPKSVVVAAAETSKALASCRWWTVAGKSERQGHYK
jgi:hypothetical protein